MNTEASSPVYGMLLTSVALLSVGTPVVAADPPAPAISNARSPADDAELRYWLENMLVYHGFSMAEAAEATGLSQDEVRQASARMKLPANPTLRKAGDVLRVLPYPGGRHPRIGFLEGAIRPQRETKVSVFTPWEPEKRGYVVVDVPEAIWSNLGLTYLAHTHVETIWTRQGIELEILEWNRRDDGRLGLTRKLPNGILYTASVAPRKDGVRMELTLINNTRETLTDLRVQNCVMLKGAPGFTEQTNDNKVFSKPYCACRSATGNRWVITAWEPCHRPWGNIRCPCLHSDPKFPDCAPGKTQRVVGWLSFYTGDDIESEFRRLDATGWRQNR